MSETKGEGEGEAKVSESAAHGEYGADGADGADGVGEAVAAEEAGETFEPGEASGPEASDSGEVIEAAGASCGHKEGHEVAGESEADGQETSERGGVSGVEAPSSGHEVAGGREVEDASGAGGASEAGEVEASEVEEASGASEASEAEEASGAGEASRVVEQVEQVKQVEQVEQVKQVKRVDKIEASGSSKPKRHGVRGRGVFGRALVQLLSVGALVPERVYSRRGLRARLKELRPKTVEADFAAVLGALSGEGVLPGVEIRCPQGRQVVLSLDPAHRGQVSIHRGDNLEILAGMGDGSVDLIYIDPPFNTGIMQTRTRIKTARDDDGDRVGFRGERYRSVRLGTRSFADTFDDYLGFLAPRLEHAHRLLRAGGSLFLHLDYREVHYAKVLLDQIFGRASFINEIIWAYDYGGRTTKRWPPKHDNILWYARDPEHYCFNYDAIDRIPYMAPGLVGKAKAARGKTPTDTWWHTIVSPGSREKNGYPTQKPLGILHRIIRVHTQPGDTILDFFAGSGSIGESAAMHGRHAILIDRNPEAIAVMRERLARFEPTVFGIKLPSEREPPAKEKKET